MHNRCKIHWNVLEQLLAYLGSLSLLFQDQGYNLVIITPMKAIQIITQIHLISVGYSHNRRHRSSNFRPPLN